MEDVVCDWGGGVGSEGMYKERAEPMLVSLSDLYSDNNRVLSR